MILHIKIPYCEEKKLQMSVPLDRVLVGRWGLTVVEGIKTTLRDVGIAENIQFGRA